MPGEMLIDNNPECQEIKTIVRGKDRTKGMPAVLQVAAQLLSVEASLTSFT
jgi:hypothetical protein